MSTISRSEVLHNINQLHEAYNGQEVKLGELCVRLRDVAALVQGQLQQSEELLAIVLAKHGLLTELQQTVKDKLDEEAWREN